MYVGATGAFFSDTETSTGNTFAAGDIDLLIDNTSYYNGVPNPGTTWAEPANLNESHKFFNFLDLKPDDWGEDTISIHVDTNDAYMCAEVTLTSNDDNGINEPESLVDQTDGVGNGELAQLVEFVWWADDGDNVLETDETPLQGGPLGALNVGETMSLALADSDENIWTGVGGPVPGDETHYIGKAWCFGNIGAAPLSPANYSGPDNPLNDNVDTEGVATPEDGGITCVGGQLGNESQTDSLTADITFNAVQARNNPTFQCEEPETPPEFGECSAGQQYANAAGLFDQGRTKVGALIVANRSNPAAAFGAPQTSGADSDVGFPAGSFVSLGFAVGTTSTRSLVLDFSDNVVLDGTGADLKVYEVTGGVYPDEHIKVEISQDGIAWSVAAADVVRDEEIDINGVLPWARYVRITDLNNPAGFSDSVADGYDLDAIEALNCGVPALVPIDLDNQG
jgi:predicted ribosomally synthesized peptide with SipW-like signal peptide